jgi:hypothetical protein
MPDDQDPKRTAEIPAASDPGAANASTTESGRDYGDSAGYGSGGSTLDYHDVGDDDANPVRGKRNPLDDVVKIKNPVKS